MLQCCTSEDKQARELRCMFPLFRTKNVSFIPWRFHLGFFSFFWWGMWNVNCQKGILRAILGYKKWNSQKTGERILVVPIVCTMYKISMTIFVRMQIPLELFHIHKKGHWKLLSLIMFYIHIQPLWSYCIVRLFIIRNLILKQGYEIFVAIIVVSKTVKASNTILGFLERSYSSIFMFAFFGTTLTYGNAMKHAQL